MRLTAPSLDATTNIQPRFLVIFQSRLILDLRSLYISGGRGSDRSGGGHSELERSSQAQTSTVRFAIRPSAIVGELGSMIAGGETWIEGDERDSRENEETNVEDGERSSALNVLNTEPTASGC